MFVNKKYNSMSTFNFSFTVFLFEGVATSLYTLCTAKTLKDRCTYIYTTMNGRSSSTRHTTLGHHTNLFGESHCIRIK